MYDSYFQICATLLVCRRQGASVSYGHVCLLFVFTNRQFNHSYVRGYLEKSDILAVQMLKLISCFY
jgi:hypothetical protein